MAQLAKYTKVPQVLLLKGLGGGRFLIGVLRVSGCLFVSVLWVGVCVCVSACLFVSVCRRICVSVVLRLCVFVSVCLRASLCVRLCVVAVRLVRVCVIPMYTFYLFLYACL